MDELPRPGDRATITRTFTARDVATFAAISGDDNPIHLDADAARAAGFDGPIVHGALLLGLISRLLGTRLPGPGTVYLGQEVRFLRPVPNGAAVTAHVEVTGVRADKPVVTLRTWAEVGDPAGGPPLTVLDGTATVLVRHASG